MKNFFVLKDLVYNATISNRPTQTGKAEIRDRVSFGLGY